MLERVNSTMIIVRTFVNLTMYPQYNNLKKNVNTKVKQGVVN
jgi:hypothetical protein